MSEADYIISAKIVAVDASQSGADSAQHRLQAVEAQAGQTGSAISRMFALIGGAAGIGLAVRGLIGLHAGLEDTTNSLATLYSSLAGVDIGKGLRLAQSDMQGLREDARKGVGELSDYADTFTRLLAPGLAAGASRDQLRQLTRNGIAAAGVSGRGLGQAGMDIQQALTAGVSQRTTPIVELALNAIHMTDGAFNRLKPKDKIDTLNKAFASFAPGVALMGSSWNAQMSTFQDNLKSIMGTVTQPIFDRWKDGLTKINDWLDKNRLVISEIAEKWGGRMLKLWDGLISKAGTYAAILAATQVAGMVGGGGQTIGAVGKGLLTAGRGVMAGEITLGAGSMSGLAGTLATMAAPLAWITAGFLAVKGAISEFPGTLGYVVEAGNRFMVGLDALGIGLDALTQKGSILNEIGAGLVLSFGGLADVAGVLFRAIGSLGVGLGVMLGIIGDGFKAIYYASTGDFAAASKISVVDRLTAANEQLGKLWDFSDPAKSPKLDTAGGDLSIKKGGDNITNLNGPIALNLKTEMNADPDRVVTAFGEGIDKIRLATLQAKRIPGARL